MSTQSSSRAGLIFAAGAFVGVVIGYAALRMSGVELISASVVEEQAELIDELRNENRELTDDLFLSARRDAMPDLLPPPYDYDVDASAAVAAARQQAATDQKFLMVTFGANWCLDCRTLHQRLNSPEVQAFTSDRLDFVNVNVGKFNLNTKVASDLGVDLRRGIPVAVFFAPDGTLIGATNDGELEPARYYTSKQILKFVRDIVERSMIAAPDSVH